MVDKKSLTTNIHNPFTWRRGQVLDGINVSGEPLSSRLHNPSSIKLDLVYPSSSHTLLMRLWPRNAINHELEVKWRFPTHTDTESTKLTMHRDRPPPQIPPVVNHLQFSPRGSLPLGSFNWYRFHGDFFLQVHEIHDLQQSNQNIVML